MKSAAISLCLMGLTASRWEGSGEFLEKDDDDDIGIEGSGEEDYEELRLVPDQVFGDPDIHFDISDTYAGADYNEALMNYAYEYSEGEDNDSVLKITKDIIPDVEINPKPSDTDEDFIVGTSKILIMAASACVSFIIVLLTFYMCHKTVTKKEKKLVPFIVGSPNHGNSQTSIVKDYRRVPTDTQEYLQSKEKILIEMGRENHTETPLLNQSP